VSGLPSNHRFPIAAAIRELLESRGISQKTLADSIGLTESAVSRIVSGERYPSMPVLFAIAGVLGVRPADLLRYVK
jgi:transcriptional regulator with XRE-family HTH domain